MSKIGGIIPSVHNLLIRVYSYKSVAMVHCYTLLKSTLISILNLLLNTCSKFQLIPAEEFVQCSAASSPADMYNISLF